MQQVCTVTTHIIKHSPQLCLRHKHVLFWSTHPPAQKCTMCLQLFMAQTTILPNEHSYAMATPNE
jgi:hypothetical protein